MKMPKWFNHVVRRVFNSLTRPGDKFSIVVPYLGKNVLELGCGSGTLIPLLALESQYIGIDFKSELITALKSQYTQYEFHCFNLDEEMWPDFTAYKPFSSIVLLAVIEHLKNPGAVLAHCRALMDSTSLLIITTPTGAGDWVSSIFETMMGNPKQARFDPHINIYKRENLEPLAKASGLVLRHYQRLHWHRQNQLFIFQKM
jgi:2-polyprenyl-3-methyl-5-hydroxy-6-metoxy-1,4-benzoquinol methylase